jgi:hypothetical protein
MGGSAYDIGIPMDLQEHLLKMTEALSGDAKVTEIAHALMRDSVSRITQNQKDIPKTAYDGAVRDWWKTVGGGRGK